MVYFTSRAFQKLLEEINPDAIFILIDRKVLDGARRVLCTIKRLFPTCYQLQLHAGEEIKSLLRIEEVTAWLNSEGATQKSLIVAIGGGALLDFAGFLAAIYKRGVSIAYLPTTLLAMVDAAYGGKTAIDVLGVKNLLGVIRLPNAVFIHKEFLSTLSNEQRLSGFGELLKYGLLEGVPLWNRILGVNPLGDLGEVTPFIEEAICIKQQYVSKDLFDKDARHQLNLGHTVGHAFEAFSRTSESLRILLHGEAVVLGLICELYLSHHLMGFPSSEIYRLTAFARNYLAPFPIKCTNYPVLLQLVRQDKKNLGNTINVILLKQLGEVIECSVKEEDLLASFDFYRDLFGY